MRKLRKTIYITGLTFILLFVMFFILLEYFSSETKFDRALMHYNSPNVQKHLVTKLEQLDIPYRIDKHGYVQYQSSYEAKIREISEEIKREHSPELPSISLTDDKHKEFFVSLLKQANIPFKIKRMSNTGNYIIEWDWNDNDEVQKLKAIFYKAMSGNSKPPKIAFSNDEEKRILFKLLDNKDIPYKVVNSDGAKTISGVNEVIEYEWSYYNEVQELRLKARNIMREEKVKHEKR